MLVKERMTLHPITITPDLSLYDALRIMRENKVRRLPVLDKKGKLVGIVLEKDLLYASPSPATSLSVHELNYLVSKIKIDELMTRDVVTVDDDCPLEDAARVMVDHNISGLPVMRDGKLVGMITESDLFETFLELLGARAPGLRVTTRVVERPGELARLAQEFANRGANVVSLSTFAGDDPSSRELVWKIQGLSRQEMLDIGAQLGAEIVDIRET